MGRSNPYFRIGILAACVAISASAAGWTDRKEYDLVLRIRDEASPQKRLALLDQWTKEYPKTGQRQIRSELYLAAYQSMDDSAHVLDTAREILAEQPESLVGTYWCALLIPETKEVTPELLTLGEQAARRLLAPGYLAKQGGFAAATEETRQKQQKAVEQMAARTLGWIDWQRKDYGKAEQAFTAYLAANPNDAQVSAWLAAALVAQPEGEKQVAALWQLARSASLKEDRALPEPQRRQVNALMEKLYASYHGSEEGIEGLRTSALTAALPPAGFSIESAAVIAARRAEEEFAFRNPQLAAWQKIRKRLEAADGSTYFDASVRGAALPKLKGTLIRFSPPKKPNELVLALSDSDSPEVVLKLSAPLPNEAPPGTTIEFEGTGDSFTASPFSLVLLLSPEKVEGWPPPPARK